MTKLLLQSDKKNNNNNFKRPHDTSDTLAGVDVAECLLGVQADADIPPVGRRRVAAGSCTLVVSAAAAGRALGPGRPAGPGTAHFAR